MARSNARPPTPEHGASGLLLPVVGVILYDLLAGQAAHAPASLASPERTPIGRRRR